jgi:hypothetical protein
LKVFVCLQSRRAVHDKVQLFRNVELSTSTLTPLSAISERTAHDRLWPCEEILTLAKRKEHHISTYLYHTKVSNRPAVVYKREMRSYRALGVEYVAENQGQFLSLGAG